MHKNSVDYKQERAGLVSEARSIVEKANAEHREMTSTEKGRFDGLMNRIDALKATIEAMEKIDGVRSSDKAPDMLGQYAQENGYSVMSAVRSYLTNNGRLDGVEKEVHDELQHRGMSPKRGGILIPFDLPYSIAERRAAFNTTTGAGALSTVTLPNYIDRLRDASVTDRLGVTWMTGLLGITRIPRLTASASVSWIAEGSNVSTSSPSADYIQLTPKTLASCVPITRKLALEAAPSVQKIVEDDLIRSVSREIDRVMLNGSGSGEEPAGLLTNGSLNKVALGTNGGALTWASVVDLENQVLTANGIVNQGSAKYLTSPTGLKSAKTVSKGGSYPTFLYDDSTNTLNGYGVEWSNLVPLNLVKGTSSNCTAMVFGDWSQVVIGSFGPGYELVIDPYTRADYGDVRLVALHDIDIAFRHIESFSAIVDMT